MTGTASPPLAPGSARIPWSDQWALLRRRHPQWWVWAVAGIGWVVLVAHFLLGWLARGQGPLSGHADHPHTGPVADGFAGLASSVGMQALGWIAMVAVMAPLIGVNVRYAALRSPHRARTAVTADVVAGWAAVWLAAAVFLAAAVWALTAAAGQLGLIALATAVAVAWQASRVKQRHVARCSRRLAPPLDRREARRASQRFGVSLGRDCVLSCWPLMALMAAAGHAVPVAAACVGVAWYERRRRPHHDPATRPTALVIAAIGVTALVAVALL